ncbi:heparan-alpha-glucosaminide N-acetyltransferase domain-containing protein [Rhodococcus sp. IEGM 1379]|uniref:heparan-alpha-glucosaminide N-acetyltransferase domain-containing protein n=1 Tax=Rhodococcus sp. IEGM 1379 TaxID=3047086 RepID=UPI0024B8298F|nr:heparan-alpha-glucosaminide N-acetyltransferase domain-containing protein [Rhodococcus sp. IEGM 1379]MDI9914724.1 heparan-alpha-glucosaminide N-acetyltransferase domain-containing protein [Rhodococcus sp. IEGM 1379]
MTVSSTAPTEQIPVVAKKRLLGIDAARGIALLGMMAVHSLIAVGDDGSPTLSYSIAAGRSSALFAVLAGVGIAFTTGRARVRRENPGATAASLAARAAVVGAIGLAMGYGEPELAVVILPYYAILFLLAIPLVFLPTRVVAAVGVGIALAVPVLIEWLSSALPEPSLDNVTFVGIIENPVGWMVELLFNGEFPALPWMAYMCAGIVIGRLRLTSANVAGVLLVIGSALAVGARILAEVLLFHLGGLEQIMASGDLSREEVRDIIAYGADGSVFGSTWWWLAVDGPHSSTPLDLLGTVGSSMAVIGAALFLGHLTGNRLARMVNIVMVPLAAAGSMTLTLYVLHIWFINSNYDIYSAWAGYILQVLAALGIGLFVRLTAGRGPLEAFVTMVANRSSRAVTDSASKTTAAERE